MYYILKVRRIIKRFAVIPEGMPTEIALMKSNDKFRYQNHQKGVYHKEYP